MIAIILRILALASWLALAYDLLLLAGVFGKPEPASMGMDRVVQWLASFVLAALTWMLLAALFFRVLSQGLVPPLIFVISASAVTASLFAVSSAIEPWPVVVPIALAPILAAYMTTDNSSLAGLALAVSLLPWPRFFDFLRHR